MSAETGEQAAQLRRGHRKDGGRAGMLYTQTTGRVVDAQALGAALEEYPSAVAHHGDELVGFVHTAPLGPDVLEVRGVHVQEEHRGKGIGAALLTMVEAEAHQRWEGMVLIDTSGTGTTSTRLYERNGYRLSLETDTTRVYTKSLRH